jgi:23S rRNA (guanosine2251-2'-O)-methyltransferase
MQMKSRGHSQNKRRDQKPARKGSVPPQRHGQPPKKQTGFSTEGRWVIGIHSCTETIKTRPEAIQEVLFRSDWENSEAHRKMADLLKLMDLDIKPTPLDSLNPLGSGHQGAALRVTANPEVNWKKLEAPGKQLVLILDGIEDPHNLGSMLRTAWLAGASAIFIPEDRAVGLTPTVCKIASGGAEHVAVEAHTNFAPVVKQLKDAGFWLYGLAEAGKALPWELKLPDKVAWVVGSEGSGMRITTERLCDELVRLPQVESGSSYNASIAAAMALMETCRQLGSPR